MIQAGEAGCFKTFVEARRSVVERTLSVSFIIAATAKAADILCSICLLNRHYINGCVPAILTMELQPLQGLGNDYTSKDDYARLPWPILEKKCVLRANVHACMHPAPK